MNAVTIESGGEASDPQRRFELVSERKVVPRIGDEDVKLVRPHRLVRQQLSLSNSITRSGRSGVSPQSRR
jgi:hypothetical protein